MIVRFWEARIVEGRLDEAVAWARDELAPAAVAAGATDVEVVSSAADAATSNPPRVVVLTRWASTPSFTEPAADPEVVARSHSWNFTAE